MQGRADTANLSTSFTGSHRFVLDYLVEEVLGCQSEQFALLLQTSVLERLRGPLCEAVTGQEDGQGDVGSPGASQPVRSSSMTSAAIGIVITTFAVYQSRLLDQQPHQVHAAPAGKRVVRAARYAFCCDSPCRGFR